MARTQQAAPVINPKTDWFQEGKLVLPPDLEFEAWEFLGEQLRFWSRNSELWIGDWWRYGEHRYGERAAQAAPTGYQLKTLQNAARVAEKIEPARRREDLTFSHHEAVAAREPVEQDELLARAAEGQWTVEKLRAKVRHIRATEETPDAYCWTYVCEAPSCLDTGPEACKATGLDRSYLFQWLDGHEGSSHRVVLLGEERMEEWRRTGFTEPVGS